MRKEYRINRRNERTELGNLREELKQTKRKYAAIKREHKYKENKETILKSQKPQSSNESSKPFVNKNKETARQIYIKNKRSRTIHEKNVKDFRESSKPFSDKEKVNEAFVNSSKETSRKIYLRKKKIKSDNKASKPIITGEKRAESSQSLVDKEKQEYKKKKKEYKVKKRAFKKKYSKHRGKKLLNTTKKLGVTETVLKNNEDFSRYIKAKNQYVSKRYSLEKGIKGGAKVVKTSSRITYGGVNRTYNMFRGRGFIRTPKEFTIKSKIKNKLAKNKKYQKLKKAKDRAKKIGRPFGKLVKNVLKNPLGSGGLISAFIIMMFLAIFIGSIAPANMDEADMTDTWVYFTKLDREKSTDKVIYYSDIESYIYYMNFRYDKTIEEIANHNKKLDGVYVDARFKFKGKSLPETDEGKDFLDDMWKFLNGDKDNIKTIDSLIDSDDFGLSDKEKKDWEEFKKISKDIGKFPYAKELDNFLYDKKDKEYKFPLKVLHRFGYVDKENFSDITTFVAKSSQYIYASLTGEVTVDGNDVIIQQGRKKLTYKQLDNIRVTSGSQVIRGEIIGQVKQGDNQDIKYEKLINRNNKQEWKAVNVGFYLPDVEYVEKTEVLRDFSLSGDRGNIVRRFVELVKQFEPNATNEGIAAILGTFDIESGVNPKRAEGDYFAPPVGATDSSWDDDDWLNMGGPQIYNGGHANIVRRGLGLGQWTDTLSQYGVSLRATNLRNFAKEKGKKWYDLDLQVDYMFNGDNPYSIRTLRDIITSNDSVENLTARFLREWERGFTDKLDLRIARALEFYRYLKSGGGSASFNNKEDQELYNRVTAGINGVTNGMQPHVAKMRLFLIEKFNLGVVHGYAASVDGTGHGHSDGLALDLMIPENDPKGDVVRNYLVDNFNELRIYYIIHKQRFYMDVPNKYGPPYSWNLMEDRGNPTQNHYDHIHISFKREGE